MKANYDVIVVGGGSAGSLIAGRLASETDAEVLLLEAGSWDLDPMIHVPAGYFMIGKLGTHTFGYTTVAQNQLDGHPRPFPQARVIGGGSSINAMAYVRGQPRDYDPWQDAAGEGSAWSYSDLLPHLRAMESNGIFADQFHGASGPLKVTWPPRINSLNLAAVKAFQELGLPFNPDYNGADQRGVSFTQATLGNARRSSSATAFLHPARRRPNLTVMTHALVERITFEGSRATGVELVHGRRRRRAHAANVVLSAGAFNSPRLLMLSGVGDEVELGQHRIPLVVRSPDVGRHLQDHPKVSVLAAGRRNVGYAKDAHGFGMLVSGLRYLLTRDGPAASSGIESIAYYDPHDLAAAPTVATYHVPIAAEMGTNGLAAGLTMENVVLQPRSHGRVTLRDADPRSAPLIDPNWLADPRDMETMIAGVRFARKALLTSALSELLEPEAAPGLDIDSDEQLTDFARSSATSMLHPVGTCRMGRDDDAVLDASLQVRGAEGLRVVDASMMPNLPSANTNAAVMAAASKGVELLLRDL